MDNTKYKIAICYWGLTRSLSKIYKSHIDNIYNALREYGYDYDTYMHTWYSSTNSYYVWEKKDKNGSIDDYKYINPTYYMTEDQDIFLNNINFSDYFDEQHYNKYGADRFQNPEWYPYLIRNAICGAQSQKRVTQMVVDTGIKYDYVMYVRPDTIIKNKIPNIFNIIKDGTLVVPEMNSFNGINDQFAILSFNDFTKYGNRFDEIILFRKTIRKCYAEHLVKLIFDKYFKTLLKININYELVRTE
jgi:hypothetical protein